MEEVEMAKERMREQLEGPLTRELLEERLEEGWRPITVEWERAAGESAGGERATKTKVPYGLRVADDCKSLEVDPDELRIMTAMLELIVDDYPLSRVAEKLNERGHRTRAGRPWTQTAVFNLLPRLTETAPEIFATEGWSELRRQRFLRAV
jgi:hypothetical protein